MRFIFETSNLDERFYKRVINSYIASQYSVRKRLSFLLRNLLFPITIRPSTMASQDPFFYGKNGVGGNTAPNKMVLYLNDKNENLADQVLQYTRSNINVISHEFGHKFLMDEGRSEKVPLRNDDEGGHKAGTLLNFWTAEVHDRDIENFSYWHEQWYVDRESLRFYKMNFKVLDFRDLLK